jgi:hypothetical protein
MKKGGGTMTCRNNKLFSILLFASGIFFLYPLAQAQSSPIRFIWNGTDYARAYPFTDQNRTNAKPVQCFEFDQASQKYVCQNGGQSITVPLNGYFCTTVTVVAGASPPPPTNYGYCLGQPTNTHDFDDNMVSDIAWRNMTGDIAIWLMNSAGVASAGGLGNMPATWSIVGQRDFDGNGNADLLWRDTSGNTAIWFMNGTTVASTAGIGDVPTTRSVALTGDYNDDGMSDLLWRDTSGNTAVWFMNGTAIASTVSLGNVPANWTVQSVNAD